MTQICINMLDKCIDKYIRIVENNESAEKKLVAVVERMFQRCLTDKEYKQAIGIALECRRLDFAEKAIVAGGASDELLKYTMELSTTVVQHLDFRNDVSEAR